MEGLAKRLDVVLAAAQRLVRQIPDTQLENKLKNRDRTYRSLCFHVFRVAETFLEVTEGVTLTRDSLVADPPDSVQSFNQVADYGVMVQGKVDDWWNATADHDPEALLSTYYGDQPIHNVFERTTWHCAQHTRQLSMLLQGLNIEPDGPLTPAQLDGLPVPEQVWDD